MSGSYQYSVLVRTGTDKVVSDTDDVRRLVMFFAVSRAHKLVIDPTVISDRDDFLDERPVVLLSDQFRPGFAGYPCSAVIDDKHLEVAVRASPNTEVIAPRSG